MGQYYKPVNLENKQWLLSHDYNTGLKLMEHSWIGNNFVQLVENLLIPNGAWYKARIVWAGDYADPEFEDLEGYEITLYSLCEDKNKINPTEFKLSKQYCYIVNHTKKQFVDKNKVPDKDGWKIHPLPLLTCEGNGRGGGDYRGESELIGSWARDSISIEKGVPEEYQEINFDLIEE